MADFTISLSRPVMNGGEAVSVLECREPTLGDISEMMRAIKAGDDVAGIMKLVELCAAQTPGFVKNIKAVDINKITEAFAPFLPGATAP